MAWRSRPFLVGVGGGICIACFRPALVNNARKGSTISVSFESAFAAPEIREIK
jgi:hypothetical protein